MQEVQIQVEGLRELGRALKETQPDVYRQLREDLTKVGDVAVAAARQAFTHGVARSPSIQRTAEGFHTRVRFSMGGSLVSIEQKIRKTTGTRPDYGAKQVRAMLRGRSASLDEAKEILEKGALKNLHSHGF